LQLSARYEEALRSADQALAFFDTKQTVPNWQAEQVRMLLGNLQRLAGQPGAGLRTLTKAQARARTLPSYESSKRYATLLVGLALSKHDLGQSVEASSDMAQAMAIYRALSANDIDTMRCAVIIAWLDALTHSMNSDTDAAFEEAAKAYATTQPARHLSHAEIRLLRAELYKRAGRAAEARAEHAAGTQAWKATTGRDWKPPVLILH
jgi:hypothetical protein